MWGASINAQYIHHYAGIHNEGDVGRVYVMVGHNVVPGMSG